jgi:hypothetical protein
MPVNVRRKESGGNKGLRDWERISPGSFIWKRAKGSTLREDLKNVDEGKINVLSQSYE